jgi:uncharacterized membrane protein YsdA (DUF1294 family)
MIAIIAYLVIINIAAFAMMGDDKARATRGKGRTRRIPERRLLGVSAIGGSFGGWLAMRVFRHKTKHAAFAFGLPVMAVIHAVLAVALFRYLLEA